MTNHKNQTETGTILQDIADLGNAAPPPKDFEFLNRVKGIRQLPPVDPELVASLQKKHSAQQLVADGVLARQADGELGVSPVLSGAAPIGLILRKTQDGPPFDIVNQQGSLTTGDPPVFRAQRDFYTRTWSERHEKSKVHPYRLGDRYSNTLPILVAGSDEDLSVLRMLRIPCTPSAGLSGMTGHQIRRLCDPGHQRDGDAAMKGQPACHSTKNCRFILVGCQIAALTAEVPTNLSATVSRLMQADDIYGEQTTGPFGIWQPQAHEFDRLRSAVDLADADRIRELIWSSVEASTLSVRQYHERSLALNPAGYAAARRELLGIIERARQLGFASSQMNKRLEAFHCAFDRDVVEAIIRDAMSAGDSIERALLLQAAEFMAHWHQSSMLVRSTQESVADRAPPREQALPPEQLQERLRVADAVVKIHRELHKGK